MMPSCRQCEAPLEVDAEAEALRLPRAGFAARTIIGATRLGAVLFTAFVGLEVLSIAHPNLHLAWRWVPLVAALAIGIISVVLPSSVPLSKWKCEKCGWRGDF